MTGILAGLPIALIASITQYLLWGLAGVLVAVTIVAILLWRKRKRWPLLAALAKHPFAKYILLSVFAHVALVVWLLSSSLFSPPEPGPPAVVVRLGTSDRQVASNPQPKPWQQPAVEAVEPPKQELVTQKPEPAKPVRRPETTVPTVASSFQNQLPKTTPPPQPKAPKSRPIAKASPVEPPIGSRVEKKAPSNNVASRSENKPIETAQPKPAANLNRVASDTSQFANRFSKNEFQQTPRRDEQPKALTNSQLAKKPAAAPTPPINELPKPKIPQSEPPKSATLNRITSNTVAPPPKSARLTSVQASTSTPRETFPRRETTTSKPNAGRKINASVPPIYHDRLAGNRLAIARARGGSINTERAVKAALAWLASAQNEDGRWDASQFGSGRPTYEGGHDRRGAGRDADTGITGLAVLAFLGSGHTHHDGEYAEVVRDGLKFLAASQASDGSLAGNSQMYASMYCHGIASLAMSEAYSLTGDRELLPTVESAIKYTISMQHPTTGGWRYRRGEEGDTSQLGWQLMALTSAHYAGLEIPNTTWSGASRFLRSVTSRDGRAAYRPGQLPSNAMTAEAMLCTLFLRTPTDDPQIQSAARYLVRDMPGSGRTNYYYWYYGTLALYHLQDENWQRWNTAAKKVLVGRQRGDGSWSADSVWGTSGGKVYSTALGALTLEVYYRYRPLARPSATRNTEHTAWRRN